MQRSALVLVVSLAALYGGLEQAPLAARQGSVTGQFQLPAPPPPPPATTFGPGQLPPRDPQQQQPATGTGVIRGRLVHAETGQPLRSARVSLSSPAIQERRGAITDEQGQYEFDELPAGRYMLTASKGGFVTLSYGQRRPFESPRPLELADRQILQKIDFNLPRGGVVTGTIVDEFGEPVTEVMVQVGRLRFVGGRQQFTPAGGRISQTDDRGEFRTYGLPPGDYYISAGATPTAMNLTSSGSTGYTTTYYPGTPSLGEALPVTVGLGQETTGIVFGLLRSRVATVSGIVLDSNGTPVRQSIVMVRQALGSAQGGMIFMRAGGMTKPDGSFALSNLPPGEYTIEARQINTGNGFVGAGGESATANVTVTGDDISGLTLVMSAGATARGFVRFEGSQLPERLRPTEVRLFATEPVFTGTGNSSATPEDDWSFELTGLRGQRLIRATAPQGWSLKSVTVNGAETTDTPLDFSSADNLNGVEILLTQQQTSLSGVVKDGTGGEVGDYVVVVFAEDSGRWGFQSRFVKIGRPDQEGRYEVSGLPPARYLAVAVEYLESGEETNPDTLERLRVPATSLSLEEGESQVLDLGLSSF